MSRTVAVAVREISERRAVLIAALVAGLLPFASPLLPGVRADRVVEARDAWALAIALSFGGATAVAMGATAIARDLPAVQRIHETYTGSRQGAVVRDAAAWEATLRNGGNPHEEFLLALRAGEVVAYARAAVLSGFLILTELGRTAEAAEPLAALMRQILTPRTEDTLARPGRASPELRVLGVAPPLLDDALAAGLRARGVGIDVYPDPNAMLRVLDAPGLAKAAGMRLVPGDDATALLRRILPPERFSYWAADRF